MSADRALPWNLRSGTPYLSSGQSACDICGSGIRSGHLVYRAEVWSDGGRTSHLTEIHEQCSTPQPLPTGDQSDTSLPIHSDCLHGGSPDTCPPCRRARPGTVWITTFGFHYDTPMCGALANGRKGAMAAGKTENPIIETTFAMAINFGAKPCGVCFPKRRR